MPSSHQILVFFFFSLQAKPGVQLQYTKTNTPTESLLPTTRPLKFGPRGGRALGGLSEFGELRLAGRFSTSTSVAFIGASNRQWVFTFVTFPVTRLWASVGNWRPRI
jgi:hypothetical protein